MRLVLGSCEDRHRPRSGDYNKNSAALVFTAENTSLVIIETISYIVTTAKKQNCVKENILNSTRSCKIARPFDEAGKCHA